MRKLTPLILLCFLLLSVIFSYAQKIKGPDDFLLPNGKEKLPSIFLVGAFHFEYYNLDANKNDESKQVNILSTKKQQELKQLLDYIAIFKPQKSVSKPRQTGKPWKNTGYTNQVKKTWKEMRYSKSVLDYSTGLALIHYMV